MLFPKYIRPTWLAIVKVQWIELAEWETLAKLKLALAALKVPARPSAYFFSLTMQDLLWTDLVGTYDRNRFF